MVHLSSRFLYALAAVLTIASSAVAQKKPAYDLIPASAQAALWIPDGDRLAQQWERTQLYDLTRDAAVAPFFQEQRQEIEKRLVDAGWRLHIKPEDLGNCSNGQIALAWMEIPTVPLKPYAMLLLADVDDPRNVLMGKVDQELTARKATKVNLTHKGVGIVKYSLPKRADSLLSEDSYYAKANEQFIATDDEAIIKSIIEKIVGNEPNGKVLSQDPDFIAGREKALISGQAQVEYFVRPLGFARVLRAIGGKRSKSHSTDVLAVLQNQGFGAIKCVCGEVALGLEKLDIAHRGYVLADQPLPKAAAVLDFPNNVSHAIPNFISNKVSSLLATHWNAKVAFWKTEGLVDELAGTPGVFHEVIEGIKMDINGPRIDIRTEVLPHLTNDIYSISDNKPGQADVDSRRNLIAVRLNSPAATAAMADVLDRAMKNEPDAELIEFQGQHIWKVVHRDDEEVVDLAADFGGDFGAPAANPNQPQPWLSNWAITVFDEYLMFASHADLITEAIQQAQSTTQSPLLAEQDYERVKAAITQHFGSNNGSAWQIVRTSLAYRVPYELFREGKLMESQSMLASILDRLLQNETEMRIKEQKLSGSKLPPFNQISHFLQPSGLMVRSTPNGWEFGSVMLTGNGQVPASVPDRSANAGQGTARAGYNSEATR